jgi:hypothetical protein
MIRTVCNCIMVEHMFPDVFAYTNTSKQDLQLSLFYDKHPPRTTSAPLLSLKASASTDVDRNGECLEVGSTAVYLKPPQLPPSRRVVKLTIVPQFASLLVGGGMAINTVLCLLIQVNISPLLATMWGSFICLWLLVSFLQLVSHSVYMCTRTAVLSSLIHIFIVAGIAVLVPHSLFARWLWIQACLSTVIASHQSLLFVLVYSHLHNCKLYATAICVLALTPMTQLVRLDPTNEETLITGCVYSVITISTLYGFALANTKGAVIVEVTVGACPTSWQSQE